MSESTQFQDHSEEVWPVLDDAIDDVLVNLPDQLTNEIPSSTIEDIAVSIREFIIAEFTRRGISSREAMYNIIEVDDPEEDPSY